MHQQEPGLKSSDALLILHNELQNELRASVSGQRNVTRSKLTWMAFLHHSCVSSLFHWTSALILLLCALFLFIAFCIQDDGNRQNWLAIESLLILTIFVFTLYFLWWDDKLKKQELTDKIKRTLNLLHTSAKDCLWTTNSFLHLHSPLSPCVTLQWTARDGNIVNLPCAFLVEGDIIYVRPGQVVLVDCEEIQYEKSEKCIRLSAGDVYNPTPPLENCETIPGRPQARKPLVPKPFIVKETPFVRNLRQVLSESNKRPTSILDNERYQTYSVWIEKRLIIVIFFVSLLTNSLRFVFIGDYLGDWTEIFLSLQVQAILPLTTLVFPLLWKFLDMYGIARVLSLYQKAKKVKNNHPAESVSCDALQKNMDFELESKDIWHHVKMIIKGESDALPRTCNLLHSLGSATSFCCIDKKGILSWPNPTAEKVFFLTSESLEESHNSSHQSAESGHSTEQLEDEYEDVFCVNKAEAMHQKQDKELGQSSKFQVLDLTQATENHFGLYFDDPSWKKHLSSLKPLGLNILLNTCNLLTAERYTQFADHLTCASLKQEVAVPVVNRRCFCGLAYQMGFSEKAADLFNTEQVLGLYRHVPSEGLPREKLTRSKSFIKYKMPMPHMFSVVVRESTSGGYQLFSQGTADLLLDACSDYWDGEDICPLSESERKKILDFYQRTSMASYCTAFSYCPLTHKLGQEFEEIYIEVPQDAHDLFPSMRSPAPSRSWDDSSFDYDLHHVYHHTSVDSLIMNSSLTSIHDLSGCFREQCNQVFIGMITMQYQAKQDIVDLIEDLDSACIRFVHFSKENELRSRVFSEKMGLEAGWNCHISLLSEAEGEGADSQSQQNISLSNTSNKVQHYTSHYSAESLTTARPTKDGVSSNRGLVDDPAILRRFSAPGAINLDTSLVKFEMTPCLEETEHQGQDAAATVANAGMIQDREKPAVLNCGAEHQDMPVRTPLLGQVQTGIRNPDGVCLEMGCLDESGETLTSRHQSGISVDSQPTSSYITENTDSVAGGWDLSNRAKLPKGIQNIRPHIENVDNVPLLVSLFTDCTPETTKEMLAILQEYGEVVCCLGSSANIYNTELFLQADCSISVEPLYTQICMKHTPLDQPSMDQFSPMRLCALLQSLPCCLSIDNDDCISVMKLIALARHHCQQMRHMFLFYIMCQLTVTLVHTLGSITQLPPPLSAHHTLWLVVIVTPLLSLTLMANPLDVQVVKMAQGKNVNHLTGQSVLEFVKFYLLRYAPSVFVCLICHCLTLSSFCQKLSQQRRNVTANTTSTCHITFGDVDYPNPGTWNGWTEDYHAGLVISQNIVTSQLVLYLVCGSLCYVHHLKQLWEELPFVNRAWCIVVPLLIILQIVYFTIDITLTTHEYLLLKDVPIATWILATLWMIAVIPLHEFVKKHEARKWRRYQKRARLDFGTKLGMNSPF